MNENIFDATDFADNSREARPFDPSTLKVGDWVQYDPTGDYLPIEEDVCRVGLCVGKVAEITTAPDMTDYSLVRWHSCCFAHRAQSPSDYGHETPESGIWADRGIAGMYREAGLWIKPGHTWLNDTELAKLDEASIALIERLI